MKLAFFLTVALVSASAQALKQPAPAAMTTKPAVGAEKPPVPLKTISGLEKELDERISTTGKTDPCVVVGGTRGVYVNGLGAVFTTDVDLVNSPGAGAMMGAPVSVPQKADVHKRKLAHVVMLQQTMRDMLLSISASPALRLADTEQVVVAVRLVYRPWEDIKDLPGQIVMRMEHRGAPVTMELQ